MINFFFINYCINRTNIIQDSMFKINDLVWIKQSDVDAYCWVLGKVVGFTPKRIKCENLTRDCYKDETFIGNYKPSSVRKLTEEEIKERNIT